MDKDQKETEKVQNERRQSGSTYEFFEKRSARFGKPPQAQIDKLDTVLGLSKEKNEGENKK